jgi:Protein of unknown function (DUF2442)
MTSGKLGTRTLGVEVTNVSSHGFWLLIGETERFVPFKDFPWFKDARIRELINVELPSPHHLYWPELDVDLAIESIEHPERFPLVSRGQSAKAMQPPRSAAKPNRVPSARKKRSPRWR